MRHLYASPKIKWAIGDVRDYGSLSDAMAEVDFVFHAAALKQVPSCEFYPMEAVRTNVLGTENVCNAATANGVKRVILLSTDKAAYPINAMGMSKALAEKIVAAKSRVAADRGTVLCCTRYGNVMASRGSVIPLFIEQIRAGKPLTVTDPRMTRFMMSIDDAVNLVLYAFENSEPGDLFVRKGAGCDDGNAVRIDSARVRPAGRHDHHRYASWREALRDASHPRRNGARDRYGRLLPRPGRHARFELSVLLYGR